jgi:hypothetical protein
LKASVRAFSVAIAIVLTCLRVADCRADEQILEPSLRGADRTINLPYGFWNETFGTAVGYAFAINGYPQPQAGVIATVMAGTEGSAMGFVMGQNIRLFGVERLFFDPVVSSGYFKNVDVYIDGNPKYLDEQAGSNDSHANDYVTGDGWDTFVRFRFRYLLPIGSGREHVLPNYTFDNGLLSDGANGGTSMNPLRSGRTFVELRPFYRSQNIENDVLKGRQTTNGVEFSLFWDNRDYPGNPSQGNALAFKVARDEGWFNSNESWTSVGAEYDHYVSLGASDSFRQRVLAFDFWSAYSPTWSVQADGTIDNRPPGFSGATLGGLWRLRAFPAQRFNDKAGIYYGAELRMIPNGNFFDHFPALQRRVGVEWIQLVGFVEAGRVARDWSFDELHSDMKWDVGFGIRAWAKGIVVRVDTAYSEEGLGVQMMIGQPFQF